MSKKNATQDAAVSNFETALKMAPPVQAPPVETLSVQDKTELADIKTKLTAAQEKAQLTALQVQNAELTYNNIILRLALKYSLIDGDLINENGEITRKAR
jgi:hypothetical protein